MTLVAVYPRCHTHCTVQRSVMAIVYVTYPGDATTHFDRTYYRTKHLPLVQKSWESYGLQSLSVFYPEEDGAGTIAICVLKFRDEAAVAASLASEATPQVLADIKNFTDATPTQTRDAPLAT